MRGGTTHSEVNYRLLLGRVEKIPECQNKPADQAAAGRTVTPPSTEFREVFWRESQVARSLCDASRANEGRELEEW
jgi:hypothetical protein